MRHRGRVLRLMDFASAFLDPSKARSRRLVGIDYGTTKVGFALSDYGRGTLRDLRSFRIKSQRAAHLEVSEYLQHLLQHHEANGVIIGWPLDGHRQPTPMCSYISDFVSVAQSKGGLLAPIALCDEYGSTVEARDMLRAQAKGSPLTSLGSEHGDGHLLGDVLASRSTPSSRPWDGRKTPRQPRFTPERQKKADGVAAAVILRRFVGELRLADRFLEEHRQQRVRDAEEEAAMGLGEQEEAVLEQDEIEEEGEEEERLGKMRWSTRGAPLLGGSDTGRSPLAGASPQVGGSDTGRSPLAGAGPQRGGASQPGVDVLAALGIDGGSLGSGERSLDRQGLRALLHDAARSDPSPSIAPDASRPEDPGWSSDDAPEHREALRRVLSSDTSGEHGTNAGSGGGHDPEDPVALARGARKRLGKRAAHERRRLMRAARQAGAPVVLAQAGLSGRSGAEMTYAQAAQDAHESGSIARGGQSVHSEPNSSQARPVNDADVVDLKGRGRVAVVGGARLRVPSASERRMERLAGAARVVVASAADSAVGGSEAGAGGGSGDPDPSGGRAQAWVEGLLGSGDTPHARVLEEVLRRESEQFRSRRAARRELRQRRVPKWLSAGAIHGEFEEGEDGWGSAGGGRGRGRGRGRGGAD